MTEEMVNKSSQAIINDGINPAMLKSMQMASDASQAFTLDKPGLQAIMRASVAMDGIKPISPKELFMMRGVSVHAPNIANEHRIISALNRKVEHHQKFTNPAVFRQDKICCSHSTQQNVASGINITNNTGQISINNNTQQPQASSRCDNPKKRWVSRAIVIASKILARLGFQ